VQGTYLVTFVLRNGELSSCRVSHIVLRQGRTTSEGVRCKYSVCRSYENNHTMCNVLPVVWSVYFCYTSFFLNSARKCRQDFVQTWHSSNICRTEGKVVTVWATRVYGGRRRVAALILNLGTRRCGNPHVPVAAFLRTEPRGPLNGRQGGAPAPV
jgi:hypothetical protein